MDVNSINSKIAAPAPSVKVDNKVTHIKTSHVKLQQESVMTLSSQTSTSSVFKSDGAFIDFIIPAHSSALSQVERIVLQLDLNVEYPASTANPVAYILPPTYRFFDRIELFSGMQLMDTIRGDHLFFQKTFKHQEELANQGKIELFDTKTYDLANQYPGLYVTQNGSNAGGTKSFRAYLNLEDTFITAHGFFLPKISSQLLLRFYFKTFDNIKTTNASNNPLSMSLGASQMILSGIKYAVEEEESLLKNDYNDKYSVKTLVRRWNESRLNFDTSNNALVDVSYLRGTFLTVGFYILPNNPARGEMGIQKVLSADGVRGIVNSVRPSEFGSSLDYSLAYPIGYKYTPETFSIRQFNFLDSSNRPVYVTNQDGNILRHTISTNNSEVDFQSKYSIYRFDFTSNPQKDVDDECATSGYRWIDGLYSLQIQSDNDLTGLTQSNGDPIKPVLVGLGYQLAELIIKGDGTIDIIRH